VPTAIYFIDGGREEAGNGIGIEVGCHLGFGNAGLYFLN